MSLIAMLEATKSTAMDARAERKAIQLQAACDFDDHGADLAKAFDEEEIAAAEEALRLGLQLDEQEDEAANSRLEADAALAKRVLESEEGAEASCSRDEVLARKLDEQERAEAERVAKLEKRQRELSQRKERKEDAKLAEQLAIDIEREHEKLELDEARDRRLAQKLVAEESKLLKDLPQTEEKLRTMAREVNGPERVSVRTRLRAKLNTMRKGLLADVTNKHNGNVVVVDPVTKRLGGQLEAAAA